MEFTGTIPIVAIHLYICTHNYLNMQRKEHVTGAVTHSGIWWLFDITLNDLSYWLTNEPLNAHSEAIRATL